MTPADLKPERPDSHFGAHDFVPSEFAPESGKCDSCGQLADAPVHTWVDPQVRIAAAMESIAGSLDYLCSFAGSLGNIMDVASKYFAAYAVKYLPDWEQTFDDFIARKKQEMAKKDPVQ